MLIHGLKINYIAFFDNDIRSHKYKIEDFTEEEINRGLAIRSYKYKQEGRLDQPRKVECFITGAKLSSMIGNIEQENAGFFIETESFDDLFFIKIKSSAPKNSFQKVHINCIEYYDKSRTMKEAQQILVFKDKQIEDSRNTDLYKCQSSVRSKLTITDMSDFSLINNKMTFFYGFTGFLVTFNCSMIVRVIRFIYGQVQFKDGQFFIEYQTYADSNMAGITSSFFVFVNGVSTCQLGQYLSQNKCELCDKGCIKCYPFFFCTQCSQELYIWDKQCFSSQPDNTFCDKMNCISCINPSCKQFDSTLIKCICKLNHYRFNDNCYQEKPSNTFCKKVPK